MFDIADDEVVDERLCPFRVTDLKQWSYCRRILYYELCLPSIRPVTYKMEAGIEAGQQEAGREQRRSLRAYGIRSGEVVFDFRVASAAFGLRGVVDMVIWPEGGKEAVPVDYKLSRKVGTHFKLQLAAYAVLLEACLGVSVRRGFLYLIPLREAVEVKISAYLRKRLVEDLKEMQTMFLLEQMPPPAGSVRQCAACEFRRFCNDVV